MQDDVIPAPDEGQQHSMDAEHRTTSAPVAPWLHTVGVLLILLLTTMLGHMRAADVAQQMSKISRYLSTGLLEWTFLGSVIAGLYHRRAFLQRALMSRTRSLAQSFGLGIAVYIAGFFAIAIVGSMVALTPLHTRTNQAVVLGMAPHTPWEFLLWFGVSLSAGFCEELIFRGYLLQQFTAWTGRPLLAIVLTSLLFGSVHLYEGLAAILPLSALALVYGWMAQRSNGDLRAVIVAHTLQDFLVALLVMTRPFVERYHPHS